MANIEKLEYKGDVYDISDAKALHQDAAGSWMPDFANLKALATYEFDIASTSYYKICERANVTDIVTLADEVLAFRITVTGTNIFAVDDCVVRVQPTVNSAPRATINQQTRSTSAATTGIRYMRLVNPKAINTSYNYVIEIAAYNATARHIKVEVFKTTNSWTFFNTATTFSYNSTNQTATDITLYDRIGLIGTSTHYISANYASYAGYKSSWDALFNSQGNFLAAGAAIAANQFVFFGADNKVYPTTSTAVEIDPAWPIVYCTTAVSSGAAVTYSYIRSWGYFTPASTILKDGTLVADGTVYMRCAYVDGKLYSSNTMTQTLTAGNTYIKLGKMYSATAVSVNVYNSEFFTLDTDGHLKALNGYLLNAEKATTAATAAAVSKQTNTSSGSYGILFDNNSISTQNATVVPSINSGLTFNPSTGMLNATGFSGSGAGLTNVPADELTGIVPLANGGTGLNGDDGSSWYGSVSLHPKFKLIYLPELSAFNIVWDGPLDGISSVNDFLASDYFKFAQKETHPIVLSDHTYLGSAMLFTGAFDTTPDPTKLYFVFPDAVYFANTYVNGISCNLAYSAEDGITADLTTEQPSFPKWVLAMDDLEVTVSGKENLANKVTSIDSSSDNDQYPSAKAVYDAISGISPGGGAGDDCYYGYCSASASSPKKTVTISNSGYTITDHVHLFVYFGNAHTYSSSTPYLSIDDVTYAIRYYDTDTSAKTSTTMINSILHNKRYMEFFFLTMSGSLVAIALPDAIPTLFSPLKTSNTRITNLDTLTTIDGAYIKYLIGSANSVTTGKPKINGADASAMILHMNWDNSNAYAGQLALQVGGATEQGGMAYRRQNGQSSGWHPWKTLADEDNIGTLTDVEHCYTATLTPAGNGTIVFPINGAKYKVTQITLINFDSDATAAFGMSRIFVVNNGGTGGYMLQSTDYFSLTSTSTDITMSIPSTSGSGMQDSTNLQVQVRYVKL